MEEKQYYVYILSSKKYETLYTGITSNLVQRIGNIRKVWLKVSQKSTRFITWCIMKFTLMFIKQ